MSQAKTAFVTGASRGIGKVVAIWLAKAGFDVCVTARSVEPGEQREHSPSASRSDTSPLPGSLSETLAAIEALGRRVMALPADITDPASISAAGTTFLERWGAPDVLVNCARHTGPGHMDKVLDTPLSAIRAVMEGNFFAPFILSRIFGPGMVARGSGVIVNFTSMSAFSTPAKPAGEGGWGITYGASKAAAHRLAGILALELGPAGVLTFNVDPGYTWTERIAQDMGKFGFAPNGAPPEVSGAVTAWLATRPEAAELSGRTIFAQAFCAEHGLLDGWDASKLRPVTAGLDSAAEDLGAGRSLSRT